MLNGPRESDRVRRRGAPASRRKKKTVLATRSPKRIGRESAHGANRTRLFQAGKTGTALSTETPRMPSAPRACPPVLEGSGPDDSQSGRPPHREHGCQRAVEAAIPGARERKAPRARRLPLLQARSQACSRAASWARAVWIRLCGGVLPGRPRRSPRIAVQRSGAALRAEPVSAGRRGHGELPRRPGAHGLSDPVPASAARPSASSSLSPRFHFPHIQNAPGRINSRTRVGTGAAGRNAGGLASRRLPRFRLSPFASRSASYFVVSRRSMAMFSYCR
jgi:hypothetical protein